MKIDNNMINQLAIEARLRIEPEALPSYIQHLTNFLQLMELLAQIDTTSTEPLLFPLISNNE